MTATPTPNSTSTPLRTTTPTTLGLVLGKGSIASTVSGGGTASFKVAVREATGTTVAGTLYYQDPAAGLTILAPVSTVSFLNGHVAILGGIVSVGGQQTSFVVVLDQNASPTGGASSFAVSLGTGYSDRGRLTSGFIIVRP